MKALINTLVLSLVLVACVVLLRSLKKEQSFPESLQNREPVASGAPLGLSELEIADFIQSDTAELYTTGLEFMEQWHVSEAIAVFKKVVERDSLHAQCYLKLAECYSDPLLFNEDLIRLYLEKAHQASSLGQNPGGEAEGTLLASAMEDFYLEGDPESALAKIDRIDKSGANLAETHMLAAKVCFNSARLSRARKEIDVVLAVDESHGRARALLVRILAAQGDLDEAERLAKDLAALYPGEPFPYVLLARVELLKGNIKDAFEFCNSALNLDPRYLQAILEKGHLYAAGGQYEAARVSFEKLLLFDDPILASSAWDAAAYIDFLEGEFDHASASMNEAIRLAASNGSSGRAFYYIFKLIDYLCELGQGDEAEAVLRKWLYSNRGIPFELGRLRLNIFDGELMDASKVLEASDASKASDWNKWMRIMRVDYNEMKALTFIKKLDYKAAAGALSGSTCAYPYCSRDYFLGYVMFEMGKAEEAATYFEKAAERPTAMGFPYYKDPIRYVQSMFYLGEANLARGDAEEAKHYYRRFLEHWGNSAWNLKAVSMAKDKLETLSNKPKGD